MGKETSVIGMSSVPYFLLILINTGTDQYIVVKIPNIKSHENVFYDSPTNRQSTGLTVIS